MTWSESIKSVSAVAKFEINGNQAQIPNSHDKRVRLILSDDA